MEKVKLGDLGEIVTGNTPSKKNKEFYDSSDICFFKPGDIKENQINLLIKSKEYISELAREKARMLPKKTVLVTCIGMIGKIGVLNHEATCNQQINAIIPNEKVNEKYLAYLIYSKRKYLQEIANAPVVPIINKKDFSNVEVNIYNKLKQIEIVDKLDKVQELVNIRKKQIEELDKLIKSQFVEMFGDIKSNNKNWKTKSGNELFIFSSGKANIISNLSDDFEYICYGGNGITGFSKKYLIDYDTIVIGRVGAYCGSVYKTKGKVWITDNAIYIKEFKENNNISFLEEMFKVIDFNKFANFSGQPKIIQQPLNNYSYVVPPIKLQNEFANVVKQINTKKDKLQKSLNEIEKLQESLMNKYFGE